MRLIFFLVFGVNIVFFAQQYFFSSSVDRQESSSGERSLSGGAASKSLILLSERGESGLRKNPAVSSSRAPDVEASKGPLCTMIGPYQQLLQAEYAVERLAAMGAEVHIVPIDIKEGELFWVYLPPEPSEREALNRLYELQKKNIESHVISKGELANGLSLGRFANYEEADNLLKKIKDLGYSAQIKIIPKTIQETWVVVSGGSAEKIDITMWDDLIKKQKDLEKRQNYCLGVASQ